MSYSDINDNYTSLIQDTISSIKLRRAEKEGKITPIYNTVSKEVKKIDKELSENRE